MCLKSFSCYVTVGFCRCFRFERRFFSGYFLRVWLLLLSGVSLNWCFFNGVYVGFSLVRCIGCIGMMHVFTCHQYSREGFFGKSCVQKHQPDSLLVVSAIVIYCAASERKESGSC